MARSRSSSLDSLGRRRRRGSSPYARRRGRSTSRSTSRSRSPSRGRRRGHSRSRRRSPERRRRRSYSRSRSKSRSRSRGRRSTSRSTSRRTVEPDRATKVEETKPQKEEVNTLSHLSEEEQMKLLLGFGGFETTKGKEVDENHKSAAVGTARKETKREYRQYMNRRGGFNRPLDKS